MTETKLSPISLDIEAENISQLKALFPDVACEGKIDFDKLRQVLGEYVDDDKERYTFTWNGKGQALRHAQSPSLGTLRPCKEESKHWDSTKNLYIEGDNLEVLKLLQKSYHRKVKMIYIDPPYNTGKDFVYPDNYRDSLKNYQEITKQVDENGRKNGTNTESNGKYHTKWLNMMYPRLRLARNLLRDDGVIFISIDDNEVANLRKLCDEVFGEENFVAQIPWRKRTSKSDVPFGVSQEYEWVLCIAKFVEFNAGIKFERKYYSSKDYTNDRWRLSDLTTQKLESQRPNSAFDLVDPKTGKIYKYNPNRLWGITKDTVQDYYNRGKIVFPDDYDFINITIPAYRVFESEDKQKALEKYSKEFAMKSMSTAMPSDIGMTESGNKECADLLGHGIFSFPKPSSLIKYFLGATTIDTDLILDFFSGSATTAHAVMQLNAEDNGNRRCIMVQLPEPTPKDSEARKAGYKNICEIGKERIRRAGEKIVADIQAQDNGQDTLLKNNKKLPDIGFRVLKLDTSNIKEWNPDYNNLAQSLQQHVENYIQGRTELDVVYEIMLKYGIDLACPIEELTIHDKKIYAIATITGNYLCVCLDNDITPEIGQALVKFKKERKLEKDTLSVVFKDNGFETDAAKTNIKEILKCGGIADFVTV